MEFVVGKDGETFFLERLANGRIWVSFGEANSRVTIPSQIIKGVQVGSVAAGAFAAGFESGKGWGLIWGDGYERNGEPMEQR